MPYSAVLLPCEVFRPPGIPRTSWRQTEPGVADICVGEPGVEATLIRLEARGMDEVEAHVYTAGEYFADLQVACDRAWARGLSPDADGAAGFSTAAPNRYVYEALAGNLHNTLRRVSAADHDQRARLAMRTILRAIEVLLDSPWIPIGYRPSPTPAMRQDLSNILGITHEQRVEQMERRRSQASQSRAEARRRANRRAFVGHETWTGRAPEAPEPPTPQAHKAGTLEPIPQGPTDADPGQSLAAGRVRLASGRQVGAGAHVGPASRVITQDDIGHIIRAVRHELRSIPPLAGDDPAPRVGLRQVSELRACGYQITGMTRAQRWLILTEVALPRLGRRQVVETIRLHIRLREGQRVDYSHAIGEWEHDLIRLSQLP